METKGNYSLLKIVGNTFLIFFAVLNLGLIILEITNKEIYSKSVLVGFVDLILCIILFYFFNRNKKKIKLIKRNKKLILDIESKKVQVFVYKVIEDSNLIEILELIGDRNNLCIQGDLQIKFCNKYSEYLHEDKRRTFFLFREDNSLMVNEITTGKEMFKVRTIKFHDKIILKEGYRLIVPKIKSA